MKKLLILFCLVSITGYGQIYETSKGKSYGVIQASYNQYTLIHQDYYLPQHSYTPYIQRNDGIVAPYSNTPKSITKRRITVYDKYGNSRETPGGDNDNPDWRPYNGQGGPPGDPMDPYGTPIGNELILLIFLGIWAIVKRKIQKNYSVQY